MYTRYVSLCTYIYCMWICERSIDMKNAIKAIIGWCLLGPLYLIIWAVKCMRKYMGGK